MAELLKQIASSPKERTSNTRTSGRLIALSAIALAAALHAGTVTATPLVIGMMEGYSLWQGQSNTIGINGLNTDARNRLAGQNYYSRVFEWDQVDEATSFFKLFGSSTNYLLGYSRGGYQALRVASALNTENITVNRLVQLDPVRCGGTDTYGADSVGNCMLSNPLQPISSIFSTGPQVVPGNVLSATNYYQTGGGISGERNVTGAQNIEVNQLLNDASINHSTIDDPGSLRSLILQDIAGRADSKRFMTALGGPAGLGTLAMTRNDDGSTAPIALPFEININGSKYSTITINNNGNVTLGGAYGEYTPTGFVNLPVEMIAPFWGDVDTRCTSCGEVYVAVPTADTAVITWNNVGFYNQNASKTNTFQLIIRDRNDLVGSNTDVEFRYGNLQWTTGDASGGTNGLGGQAAFAGFTGGANGAPQTLIGSGTAEVLTLNQRSNIGISGKWFFTFREGSAPGTDINNPLLPDVREDGWHFQYTTTEIDQIVWSDPEIVYGYDYEITGGSNFRSFILPILGDNLYSLWLGDPDAPYYLADIVGGTEYFFSDIGLDEGVAYFGIRGVERLLGIDPADVLAFVTGLSFTEPGNHDWVQRPLASDSNNAVPEPPLPALLVAGLVTLALIRQRKRQVHGA